MKKIFEFFGIVFKLNLKDLNMVNVVFMFFLLTYEIGLGVYVVYVESLDMVFFYFFILVFFFSVLFMMVIVSGWWLYRFNKISATGCEV